MAAAKPLVATLAGLVLALLSAMPGRAAPLPKDEALVAGFEAIVFSAELPGFFGGGNYLKRFAGPVRFHVENHATKDRTRAVSTFIASLDRQIGGLTTATAKSARDADFVVHIVDRKDYQRIGREIYRSPSMTVPGECIVRADYGRRGIRRSDALIVSDEGEKLFKRCLIEEVLQGLGPLNDNSEAPDSVFNDTSALSTFTRYDRIMLNVLYDNRLRPGMDLEAARPLLPKIVGEVRRRIR